MDPIYYGWSGEGCKLSFALSLCFSFVKSYQCVEISVFGYLLIDNRIVANEFQLERLIRGSSFGLGFVDPFLMRVIPSSSSCAPCCILCISVSIL